MSTSVALRPRRTSRATLLSYNNTKPSPLSSFLILIATGTAIIAHCAQNVSFATNNEKGPGRTKRSGKAG